MTLLADANKVESRGARQTSSDAATRDLLFLCRGMERDLMQLTGGDI